MLMYCRDFEHGLYKLHKPKLQDMLKIITINKEYYNKLLISFENNSCF